VIAGQRSGVDDAAVRQVGRARVRNEQVARLLVGRGVGGVRDDAPALVTPVAVALARDAAILRDFAGEQQLAATIGKATAVGNGSEIVAVVVMVGDAGLDAALEAFELV